VHYEDDDPEVNSASQSKQRPLGGPALRLPENAPVSALALIGREGRRDETLDPAAENEQETTRVTKLSPHVCRSAGDPGAGSSHARPAASRVIGAARRAGGELWTQLRDPQETGSAGKGRADANQTGAEDCSSQPRRPFRLHYCPAKREPSIANAKRPRNSHQESGAVRGSGSVRTSR
jgi:hypothetical protein